ncbi:YkyA family protein [Bacillus massiliglaciei]|uniref:YkyA family protein n=1 Tax=Bacillus massiliglaciei TaxID=1816693 RepID=UPI000DA6343B|nr:YkyA family protein [Bacillus massiliglaciei]
MLNAVRITSLFIVCLIFLSGCMFGASPEEKIAKTINKTAEIETDLNAQQKELAEFEEEENKYYEKIVKMGMKEFDEIKKVSDQALENIDDREKKIQEEQDIMNDSKKEFEKVGDQIEKIKDEKIKDKAETMQKDMQERYQLHQELQKAYIKGLEADRKLYEIFKKENLKMDELRKQVDASNEIYKKIKGKNDQFNKKTESYNKGKTEFFKAASIEEKGKKNE